MLVRPDECEGYLTKVAELMERYGVQLTKPAPGEDLELLEDDEGVLSFELIGQLPDVEGAGGANVEVREGLAPLGDGTYRTSTYEYELVDHVGTYRRAFHLHDPEWFGGRYLVVVHEHCERPLGRVDCEHYAGSPLKDSYAGLTRLVDTWSNGSTECGTLICLEGR